VLWTLDIRHWTAFRLPKPADKGPHPPDTQSAFHAVCAFEFDFIIESSIVVHAKWRMIDRLMLGFSTVNATRSAKDCMPGMTVRILRQPKAESGHLSSLPAPNVAQTGTPQLSSDCPKLAIKKATLILSGAGPLEARARCNRPLCMHLASCAACR